MTSVGTSYFFVSMRSLITYIAIANIAMTATAAAPVQSSTRSALLRVTGFLYVDRALAQDSRQRANRDECRREHRADDPDRQRKLGDDAILLPDAHAAHIAFGDEVLHRREQLFAGGLDGFPDRLFCHDAPPCYRPRSRINRSAVAGWLER